MSSPTDALAEQSLAELVRFTRDSVVAQGLFLARGAAIANAGALIVILAALVNGQICRIEPLTPLIWLFGAGAIAAFASLAATYAAGIWFMRSLAIQHHFAAALLNPTLGADTREATRELLTSEANHFMSASHLWSRTTVMMHGAGGALFIAGALAPLFLPDILSAACAAS